MRRCEYCETLIIAGWINEEYEEYFCSSECLEVYYPDDTEHTYYTIWEIYVFDDVQYASEDDAKFTAYKKGFDCTDVTAAKFDLNKPLYHLVNGQLVIIDLEDVAV